MPKNTNREFLIDYKSESKKGKVSEAEIRLICKYWPEIIKAVQAELNREEGI